MKTKVLAMLLAVAVFYPQTVGTSAPSEVEVATYPITYSLATVVVEIDEKNDLVITEDYSGNEWSFYGVEDWLVGDICTLTMEHEYDNEIYDDVITRATYGGDVEWASSFVK